MGLQESLEGYEQGYQKKTKSWGCYEQGERASVSSCTGMKKDQREKENNLERVTLFELIPPGTPCQLIYHLLLKMIKKN